MAFVLLTVGMRAIVYHRSDRMNNLRLGHLYQSGKASTAAVTRPLTCLLPLAPSNGHFPILEWHRACNLAGMTLDEVLALLASKAAEPNTSQESGVSFRVCEVRCHLEAATGRRRYFVRAPQPHELALLQEVAAMSTPTMMRAPKPRSHAERTRSHLQGS
jgi:hypothetical protein